MGSARKGQALGLRALGEYTSLYEARADDPEFAKYWDPWMEQQNTAALEKLESLVTYSKAQATTFSLLDWCGNTGYNSFKALDHFPALHATVLDLPAQCGKAKALAELHGFSSRLDTLPCNLNDLSF